MGDMNKVVLLKEDTYFGMTLVKVVPLLNNIIGGLCFRIFNNCLFVVHHCHEQLLPVVHLYRYLHH